MGDSEPYTVAQKYVMSPVKLELIWQQKVTSSPQELCDPFCKTRAVIEYFLIISTAFVVEQEM